MWTKRSNYARMSTKFCFRSIQLTELNMTGSVKVLTERDVLYLVCKWSNLATSLLLKLRLEIINSCNQVIPQHEAKNAGIVGPGHHPQICPHPIAKRTIWQFLNERRKEERHATRELWSDTPDSKECSIILFLLFRNLTFLAKASDAPGDFIRHSGRLAKIAKCTR